MAPSVVYFTDNYFASEGAASSGSGLLTVPTSSPFANASVDDLMLVSVTVFNVNDSSDIFTITLPTGWTHAGYSDIPSNPHRTYWFYKYATSEEIGDPQNLVDFEYYFGQEKAAYIAVWVITNAKKVNSGLHPRDPQELMVLPDDTPLEASDGYFAPWGSVGTVNYEASATVMDPTHDSVYPMFTVTDGGLMVSTYVGWDTSTNTNIGIVSETNFPPFYDYVDVDYGASDEKAAIVLVAVDGFTTAASPADPRTPFASTDPYTVEMADPHPYYVCSVLIEDIDATEPPLAPDPSDGAAAGTSTATAVGASTAVAVGAASGAATASAAGASIVVSPVAIAYDVEDGATLTFSWLTVVRDMWSGRETRASLVRTPRQKFSFTARLTDEQFRDVIARLAVESADAPTFPLALAHEDFGVESSTSSSITFADLTYCDWAVDGQRIVVIGPDGDQAVTAIDGAPSGATIDTTSDVSAVATPGSRVMPIVEVYLDPDQDLGRRRVNRGSWVIVAMAAENGYGATTQWGVGASVTTHDSIPVWDRGIMLDDARQPLISDISPIDAGLGVSALAKRNLPFWKRSIRIESSEIPEWQWFKKFLMSVLGKTKVFLLPTGRPDLIPESDASTGVLTISGADYVDDWFPSSAHRRIKITLTTGAVHYRTITACVDNGNDTQDLTLASTLAGAIARIEFLETVRLDSDEVSVKFVGWAFESSLVAKVVQSTADGAATTFDDFETSEQTGKPREIYVFELGGATTRLTSSKEDETYSSNDYASTPGLSRGPSTDSPPGKRREMTITLPVNHAIAQELIGGGIPPQDATVTVLRFHGTTDSAYQVWKGSLAEITTEDQWAHIRSPRLLDVAFDIQLPVLKASRLCQHALFGPGCQASRIDTEFEVGTVTGTTITLPDNLAPDGWTAGGEMIDLSSGESRTILSQVGTIFVVDVPFRTLAATQHVTVSKGCDGAITTCRDKFDNVANFGGHPHLPEVNPTAPERPKGNRDFWDRLFGA